MDYINIYIYYIYIYIALEWHVDDTGLSHTTNKLNDSNNSIDRGINLGDELELDGSISNIETENIHIFKILCCIISVCRPQVHKNTSAPLILKDCDIIFIKFE